MDGVLLNNEEGRYQVQDHEKYIVVASHHTTFLQICHTLLKRSGNGAIMVEDMGAGPLQDDHLNMEMNVG